MSERSWKRSERRIAMLVGGRRVPVSGRGRGDAPDVAHDWLSIECKERLILPAWIGEALQQARAAAREAQLPIAILHERRTRFTKALVVLELGDFVDWFGPLEPR